MKFGLFSTMSLLLASSLAVGLTSGFASAQVINDFDTDLESWRFDFGDGGTIVHDPTEGSPGNPAGAAKLTFDFPGGGIAFTGDLFGSPTDLTGAPTLLFDLKVDPSSSLDAFGNYGFMQFVSRETDGYNWGNQAGVNLPAVSDWQTFSVATSGDGLGMANTRAFTLQIYGGPSQNIPDDVVVWLDNVRLVPEPSALAMAGLFAVIGLASNRRKKRLL